MPYATRITDRTIGVCDMGIPACCSHSRSGTNRVGSDIFEIEGDAAHLVTHTGSCNCPHGGTFESVEGAVLVEVEGLPLTLIGHKTVCIGCGKPGNHSTGSDLLEVEE